MIKSILVRSIDRVVATTGWGELHITAPTLRPAVHPNDHAVLTGIVVVAGWLREEESLAVAHPRASAGSVQVIAFGSPAPDAEGLVRHLVGADVELLGVRLRDRPQNWIAGWARHLRGETDRSDSLAAWAIAMNLPAVIAPGQAVVLGGRPT